MAAYQRHQMPSFLTIAYDHLAVDSRDAIELVKENGSPLFVFSERRLTENAKGFLRAMRSVHPRTAVFFAGKACSNLHILRVVRREGLGIKVNSGGELWKALAVGFAPEEIIFNGVAKSAQELQLAIGRGIKAINVESAFELQRLAEVARELGRQAVVNLRLDPSAGGRDDAGIDNGSSSNKFGMTEPELRAALEIARANPLALDVAGLHLHIGSQVTDVANYTAAVSFAARKSYEIGTALGVKLRQLNLGGGFPVDYAHLSPSSDFVPDKTLQPFATDVTADSMVGVVTAQAVREMGSDVEVQFEPGRSIVANAAVLLSRIENVMRRGDMPWLYLDAGYNLLIDSAAAHWFYHMVNASRMNAAADTAYRIVGPLCDPVDCFFDHEGEQLWKALNERLSGLDKDARQSIRAAVVRLPEKRYLPEATWPGDVIALLDAGAYTVTDMSQYCGRLRAKAIMVTCVGDVRTVRDRDRFEDLLNPAEQSAIAAGPPT